MGWWAETTSPGLTGGGVFELWADDVVVLVQVHLQLCESLLAKRYIAAQ